MGFLRVHTWADEVQVHALDEDVKGYVYLVTLLRTMPAATPVELEGRCREETERYNDDGIQYEDSTASEAANAD